MPKIVCLANSWRPGGRCVVGIDEETERWVRPVPPEGGAIPRAIAEPFHLLDIIELPLEREPTVVRYQNENHQVSGWNWRRVGRAEIEDVIQYCSTEPYVLHNSHKVVEPAELNGRPQEHWQSLQLINAKDVRFEPDERDSARWVANFSVRPQRQQGFLAKIATPYSMKVTDPVVTERLNRGDDIGPWCLLTVSLTEPIASHGRPKLCYKLVAGVIEIRF